MIGMTIRDPRATPGVARSFLVDVCGYDTVRVVADSRAKATFRAFLAYIEAYPHTFREFLAIGVRVRVEVCR